MATVPNLPDSSTPDPRSGNLRRQLGLVDATSIGLGAMLGAGVFVAFAPAAAAAGPYLLLGLAVAAAVAACNATSTARLAMRHPQAGGAYLYGTLRLGPFWGYLAGSSFVIGKIASCAAMALAVGAYAGGIIPPRALAVGVVVVIVVLNLRGITRSALVTRWLLGVVVVSLIVAIITIAVAAREPAESANAASVGWPGLSGVLQGAALLFFAFAGYARLATLGEEVRDPRRTIPRAMALAFVGAVVLYGAVAIALLSALGVEALAGSLAPIEDAVRAVGGGEAAAAVVRVGAVAGACGALLALLLGVSRTGVAMARDGWLPRPLAAVDPRRGVPRTAELVVAAIVIAVVLVGDVRSVIAFSSLGVLTYYAVANAAALTLPGRTLRLVALTGVIGCLVLVVALPLAVFLAGVGLLAVCVLAYVVTSRSASEVPDSTRQPQ